MRVLAAVAAVALVWSAHGADLRSGIRAALSTSVRAGKLPNLHKVHEMRHEARERAAGGAPAAAAATSAGRAPAASPLSAAAAARFARSASTNEASASGKAGAAAGTSLNPCRNCIYVMERIKQGYQYALPSICVEVFSKTSDQSAYEVCHEVVAALSVWGHNVRHWMKHGCYKSEPYGASELIKPCPSHVICSQIEDLAKHKFCAAPGTDFVDERGGASGSSSEAKSDANAGESPPPPPPADPNAPVELFNHNIGNTDLSLTKTGDAIDAGLSYDGANTDASLSVGQSGFSGGVTHDNDGTQMGASVGQDGAVNLNYGGVDVGFQSGAVANAQQSVGGFFNNIGAKIGGLFG